MSEKPPHDRLDIVLRRRTRDELPCSFNMKGGEQHMMTSSVVIVGTLVFVWGVLGALVKGLSIMGRE